MRKLRDGGVYLVFETTTQKRCVTYFRNPPSNIDHANKYYLQEKFPNVTRNSQVEFIKLRYREEYQRLFSEEKDNVRVLL